MIVSDRYSLMYDEKRNFILIGLPQTMETATNTIGQIVDRRTDVTETDLMVLLNIAQLIFHKGERKDESTMGQLNPDEPINYHIENDGTYETGKGDYE